MALLALLITSLYTGSEQDIRNIHSSHSSTRRCSASPDYTYATTSASPPHPIQMNLLHESTSFDENAAHSEVTSYRIRTQTLADQGSGCSYNFLPRASPPPPPHRDLEATKSLPIFVNTPAPIVVKVKKPSRGSDSSDRTQNSSISSDKTTLHFLSPSPEGSEKFTKRFISSPPLSRRRPSPLETNAFDSKSPPIISLSPLPQLRAEAETLAPDPADRTAATAEDSSNDDVFGSPDHSSGGGATFRIHPPSPCLPLSTDSQGSEEGREAGELPTKSPVRKPSLLRRKQGICNAERKKRTVTFTPEVGSLVLHLHSHSYYIK